MSSQAHDENREWHCPKCNKDVVGFPALSRRNVGYAENKNICSDCGQLEALVDMADDITAHEQLLHWEFSFHQLCCGNATQDGQDEFYKFLAFRKKLGKHDAPLWKIEWLITKKMFHVPDSKMEVFVAKSKPRYDEIEASWATLVLKPNCTSEK